MRHRKGVCQPIVPALIINYDPEICVEPMS